jgi:hypothetical protein
MMDFADGKERTLFQARGVLVTNQRLVMEGRTWWLRDVEGVLTRHRPPRIVPLLISLMLGVLGLPVLHWWGQTFHQASLAAVGLAIFGSIAGLLLAEDTYWLVLRTRKRERRVFRSGDQQLITRLEAAITAAMEAERRPH